MFYSPLRSGKGQCTYDVHENCLIFKTPPPVHLRLEFFHPFGLGRPILNAPLLPPHLLPQTTEQTKSKQNISKSRHIQIEYAFYCSI